MTGEAMITLEHVGKLYEGRHVVRDMSLAIAEGECLVLVGGSGSGKSTTLRMINRLIECDEGRITVEGRDVMSMRPEALRRRIGYVIQSTGLFPHWNVARNVATVPALLGWDRARIARRVDELLDVLGLPPDIFRNRMPRALSGGQQQRVGIARALAADPPILLMDEPFSALDPITRASLQAEIVRLRRSTGKTIVFVSHDVDEALRLASRICVMRDGVVEQIATPVALLAEPASDYVAALAGGARAAEKILGLVRVDARARTGAAPANAPSIGAGETLSDAFAMMIAHKADTLAVVAATPGADGVMRHLDLRDLLGEDR